MTQAPGFIVGAYASMPAELTDQETYYDALADADFVTGLEIPYPGQLADPYTRSWVIDQVVGRFSACAITAIPGTMQRIGRDPDFGLASPRDESRHAALDFMEDIRFCVQEFNQKTPGTISFVEVHSAPTERREITPFVDSLLELGTRDWYGAELLIEHCDAASTSHQAEKGFLDLKDELDIAQRTGLRVALNWGRSAVEARGAGLPIQHIRDAAQSTLLAGVIFSGASPEETYYGPAWIDGHLPLSTDEPGSLMTPHRVTEAAEEATCAQGLNYLGAKVQVPEGTPIPQRISMLRHIYEAASAIR